MPRTSGPQCQTMWWTLQFDLTQEDSDTDSVATILARVVVHEDLAEEDEVRSVGRVEDVGSDAEEEEVIFPLPGAFTRRAAFGSWMQSQWRRNLTRELV